MWLDPPVITSDGETLRIVREHYWDFMEWAICIVLLVWLSVSALVIHAAPGTKWPQAAPFLIIGLVLAGCLVSLALFGGETISLDSRELRIGRKWAGCWSVRRYPIPQEVFTASRRVKRSMQHYIGFQCAHKALWIHPSTEEWVVEIMLEALQEHLARQRVQ